MQKHLRWRRRLFFKLWVSYWVGMNLTMLASIAYMSMRGIPPPPHPADTWMIGFVPLAPVLIGSLVSGLISLLVAWSLSSPIRHLKVAFREVAAGNLQTRALPLMGGQRNEFVDLAIDFDHMVAQLQQLLDSRTVLLHDISHELRSPLTRLQGVVSLMKQAGSATPAMQDRIEHECQRLDVLIEELLTLHRLEAGVRAQARMKVDLVELLHAIVDDADFEAQAQGKSVTLDAPPAFVTEVDGELIYRAHENVIRNAIKFSPRGAQIEVSVELDPARRCYVCRVSDRGPGVPADMLESIFEPFVRVQGSEPVRGVGLGLAIAKRTLAIHGGTIRASLRDGGGLVVTMTLPWHTDDA